MTIASGYLITDIQKSSDSIEAKKKSENSRADHGPGLVTLLRWISDLLIHLIFWAIPKRILFGPTRPNWTILHDLLIQSMQFGYRWHIMDSARYSTSDLACDDSLPHAYVDFFQTIIDYCPLFPYFPFAHHQRLDIDCRNVVVGSVKSHLHAPLLNHHVQLDIITHRNIKNTLTTKEAVVSSKSAILMIHGGAFNFRMEATWRPLVISFSKSTQSTIFIPHYRLAPRHPFPSGLYDVLSTYLLMITPESEGGFGYTPSQVFFMGESAGGGCVVSLCLLLKQMGLPKPCALYLISPWIDLTCETTHHHHLKEEDTPCREKTGWNRFYPHDMLHKPMFPFDLSFNYAKSSILYPHSFDMDPSYTRTKTSYQDIRNLVLKHPLVSPIFASTKDLIEALPPFMIQLGGAEYLLDEGLALFRRVSPNSFVDMDPVISVKEISKKKDDENFVCEVYPHMTHIFAFMVAFNEPNAWVALDHAAKYLKQFAVQEKAL